LLLILKKRKELYQSSLQVESTLFDETVTGQNDWRM